MDNAVHLYADDTRMIFVILQTRMTKAFLISWMSFFASCGLLAAENPPVRHAPLSVANGCFVESVALLDEFHEAWGAEAWGRLLQWGAQEEEETVAGHAVAVCELRGKLWCWDVNYGWKLLALEPAQREDVDRVAAPILARYPRITARFPLYRFDFPQPPDGTPPEPQLAHPEPAFRDASLVAARLARHRPVNLVQFSHVTEGETKTSAAAVFVFHGRYCVYSPERGTVPFRARGSVENLRLIQQALRRMFPGAFAVKRVE